MRFLIMTDEPQMSAYEKFFHRKNIKILIFKKARAIQIIYYG